jgi:hypothetical protein
MEIQVIDVGTPNTHAAKNGRTYQSLEVTYKGNDGKVSAKKLMSFSNPSVFKAAGSWNKGDVVDIVTQKDDAGYWQWTGIGTGGGVSAPSTSPVANGGSATATRVTGSTYETKEERAAKQILIVRQSSLSVASQVLSVGAKAPPNAADIIGLAKQFEAYVYAEEVKPIPEISDLEDDVPY